MLMSPPPPTPATTRPAIMLALSRASPHIRLPAAKKRLLNTSPGPRPKMSVSRPDTGWQAALAIRYAVASHDSSDSDWNSLAMGADSVAMMLESTAPRNTPTYTVARITAVRPVDRPSASTVRSSTRSSSSSSSAPSSASASSSSPLPQSWPVPFSGGGSGGRGVSWGPMAPSQPAVVMSRSARRTATGSSARRRRGRRHAAR